MKEIKKNSQEIIRIENKEYKGNKFLDCRVYFLDKETQEYRPTKKVYHSTIMLPRKSLRHYWKKWKPIVGIVSKQIRI